MFSVLCRMLSESDEFYYPQDLVRGTKEWDNATYKPIEEERPTSIHRKSSKPEHSKKDSFGYENMGTILFESRRKLEYG